MPKVYELIFYKKYAIILERLSTGSLINIVDDDPGDVRRLYCILLGESDFLQSFQKTWRTGSKIFKFSIL